MAKSSIPSMVLSEEVLALDRNSDEWRNLTTKVREACETSGIFFMDYAKIPLQLQQIFFGELKDMFDVPMENKMKCCKPSPLDGGYIPSKAVIPLYESFGLYGGNMVRELEKIMWPQGKSGFSDAVDSMNANLLELSLLVLRMIFESYGIGDYYESKDLEKNITGFLRTMKYRLPKENEQPIALHPHVDKTILTILFENSVHGLEALTKDGGEWVNLTCPKGHLVVLVGDALKVWSNGRVHAPEHRVTISGDQERYTCGVFCIPEYGTTMEVPEKLVDGEHPLRYKPFVYSEYHDEYIYDMRPDALEVYAGIQFDGMGKTELHASNNNSGK